MSVRNFVSTRRAGNSNRAFSARLIDVIIAADQKTELERGTDLFGIGESQQAAEEVLGVKKESEDANPRRIRRPKTKSQRKQVIRSIA